MCRGRYASEGGKGRETKEGEGYLPKGRKGRDDLREGKGKKQCQKEDNSPEGEERGYLMKGKERGERK